MTIYVVTIEGQIWGTYSTAEKAWESITDYILDYKLADDEYYKYLRDTDTNSEDFSLRDFVEQCYDWIYIASIDETTLDR